ncbi:hypothetical protein TNCV_896711 [Trichonephila clavipes]|nr:hypothetical protein TNCV_896711 [Trichonephila clavipes]
MIRLKTKIIYRKDSEDFLIPIVLPPKYEVVKRLIYNAHVKNCHAEVQMILNILREKCPLIQRRNKKSRNFTVSIDEIDLVEADNRKRIIWPLGRLTEIIPGKNGQGMPPPPNPNIDGGWGWAVVFSTFTVRFVSHGMIYTFGIYYVEFRKYFNTTSGAASLVMSILLGMTNFVGKV